MVPNKFSMVDLEGIDIVESQGIEIPGLYQKLTDAIMQCRYQVIYNWKFDGILIPPAYVEMEIDGSEVKINENISVSNADIVYIHSLEIHILPVINELSVSENGEYRVPEGVDGYNPVIVNIPPYIPVISPLSITENGTYTAPEGIDGYSPITVEVESNMHDYSNTEQVIGTWLDGKPIYEITLSTTQTTIDVANLNIETLVYSNAVGSDGSNYTGAKWMINSVSGSGNRVLYFNNGQIRREGGYSTYHIILQYTKTTDSVG